MVPAAEVDGDERGAGLDQPPGQQRALAPVVPAVAVAQLRIFRGDVERPPGGRAADELERLLARSGPSPLHVGQSVEACAARVEVLAPARGDPRAAARVSPWAEVEVLHAGSSAALGSPPVWNGLWLAPSMWPPK